MACSPPCAIWASRRSRSAPTSGPSQRSFNAAVEADLLPRTPVRGFHLETIKRRARPTITAEQLFALADAVPGRYRALILTARILGLRWSEAIGLRVRDVGFLARSLDVRQTVEEVGGRLRVVEAKSDACRRTRAVPSTLIEEHAIQIATHRPDAATDDLLFVGARGGILRRHFLARILKPAAREVGLPVGRREGLDFHGLRHIATTLMVTTGEHPRSCRAALDTRPRTSPSAFTPTFEEVDRAAARRIEQLLAGRQPTDDQGTRIDRASDT